jgi:hypothetical protein
MLIKKDYNKWSKSTPFYVLKYVTNLSRIWADKLVALLFFYLVCETIGHSWPIVPASGDSEDDCGEQMECRLAGETEVLGENLPQRHRHRLLV